MPPLFVYLLITLAVFSRVCAAVAEEPGSGGTVKEDVVLQGAYAFDLLLEPEYVMDAPIELRKTTVISSEGNKEPVAVPLPAAFWFFGSGLVAFVMLSNRR